MTHDELQAIKARAEAATPGPWEATLSQTVQIDISGPSLGQRYEDDGLRVSYVSESDATFIAHARTDVPALVAEVERLQVLVDALMNPKPGRDPRYYNEAGDYRDGKGNRFGQYCPNGKVQIEGLSAGRQFSPSSFEPSDGILADVWVDGERYNFQAGDVETKPWSGYARGLHITTDSCDLVVQQTAINACSVFVKKKIMP